MNREEIIEMANEAGWSKEYLEFGDVRLERFAKLVAQHEREQCKKLCEWKTGNQFVDEAVAVCYRAIDLRGQA